MRTRWVSLEAISLPPQLRQALEPLLKEAESLTEKIKSSDREIEQIARKDYQETALLQQVGGVGPVIALTFVLTIEDKNRFQKSRDVGCYVLPPPCSEDRTWPRQFHAGTLPKAATVVKLMNNLVLGSAMVAMAEGFSLVRKYGVEPQVLYDVMTEGLFAAPAYKGYGKTMVDRTWHHVGSPITSG